MKYDTPLSTLSIGTYFRFEESPEFYLRTGKYQIKRGQYPPGWITAISTLVSVPICVWDQDCEEPFLLVRFQADCPDRETLQADLAGTGLVLAQPVLFPILAGAEVRFWKRN